MLPPTLAPAPPSLPPTERSTFIPQNLNPPSIFPLAKYASAPTLVSHPYLVTLLPSESSDSIFPKLAFADASAANPSPANFK